MHVMTIGYFSGSAQEFLYDDEESAKGDFQTLQIAMAQYQRFKNDNTETVSLANKLGQSVFRIEHIVSVSLSNPAEPIQAEYAEWQGRMLAARKAAADATLAHSRPERQTP